MNIRNNSLPTYLFMLAHRAASQHTVLECECRLRGETHHAVADDDGSPPAACC